MYNTKKARHIVPLSVRKNVFKVLPNYLNSKADAYHYAIQQLHDKHCRVLLIQFPHNKNLDDIIKNSPAHEDLSRIKSELTKRHFNGSLKTKTLQSSNNLMHDFTHLNVEGATLTTREIAKIINQMKSSEFYEFKIAQ